MISSIGISLSGMQAAGARVANNANNIANMHSTSRREGAEVVRAPYIPQDIVQTSQSETGGVRAALRPRDPASVPVAQIDGEVVDYPNVHLEEELVGQHVAAHEYEANLKALKTADGLLKNLLDITA
jgi:flagellar basal body rod protein FlgC